MDLSELIRSYTPEQKNVFSAFLIQLPLIFTIMYLYIPAFKSLELYLQVIFAISASTLSIYYSFVCYVYAPFVPDTGLIWKYLYLLCQH